MAHPIAHGLKGGRSCRAPGDGAGELCVSMIGFRRSGRQAAPTSREVVRAVLTQRSSPPFELLKGEAQRGDGEHAGDLIVDEQRHGLVVDVAGQLARSDAF